MKRMGSLNSSGDNADKSATDNEEIFSVNDYNKNIDKYYQNQINDVYGKEEINEKIIAKVTGAKEALKKSRRD